MTESELEARRRRRAFRILETFKIPYIEVEEHELVDRPSWDGKVFAIDKKRSAFDLVHEASHWLIAPKKHRAWPNFGLGRDPWTGPARERFKYNTTLDWEIGACALDVALAFHMRWGGPERASDLSMDQERRVFCSRDLMYNVEPRQFRPVRKFLRNDGRLRADFRRRIDATK